ncbi:TraM recognition domain-containing protein, partial [Patescibacteria group bacterium]|nr:TraM recognition domain-containing protein [Patescibacteria group bacterium]
MESVNDELKHLVAAGMMGVFKKIWENLWSARMEYILNNTILALLDSPGTTLLGINRMLSDAEYRKQIVANIKDPIVKQFWVKEFEAYASKFATEAVAPIQNKVGQFLSASIIRNIVAQSKSTFNLRAIMDDQLIFFANLSKGRIGEDAMRLLGGMLITKIQMSAMERVDMPEEKRQDFYMYVDEFQNFAVESFASILSEARKYRLNLIMAHQYIAQLSEEVRDSVFGNVGTIISFRIGNQDADFMETEFMPRFTPEDLINLPKYQIYLKLMIDGISSMPFSAITLPPIAHNTGSKDRVIQQSRQRYAGDRKKIEEQVTKWSGFGEDIDLEAAYKEVKEAKKEAKKKRFSHEYQCTRCGKMFLLPVELDRSRPIYCEECMPIIEEERKKGRGRKGQRRVEKKVEKPPK